MASNWERELQQEGEEAFRRGESINRDPYPHDSAHWWHNEEWEKGWKAAQAAYDDDYDND